MGSNKVIDFPARYEAEISLAERAGDLLEERLETGQLPEDAVPRGDVTAVIDAIAELLHLEQLDEDGRTVSQKRIETVVGRLEAAFRSIGEWPEVARTRVIAPLAEILEEGELEWMALELLSLLPTFGAISEEEKAAVAIAIRRIAPLQVRMLMVNQVWAPDFESALRLLRDMVDDEPDDEQLLRALQRGVIYHALRGREEIVERERRALAAAEPLPPALASALERLAEHVSERELFTLSLHLVLADALAAGLVPDNAEPAHVVAALVAAMIERDTPEDRADVRELARLVKTRARTIENLARRLDAAFDWLPPGDDTLLDVRQQERWRLGSAVMEFMPARWVPEKDAERPPYTTDAARARVDELRERAWLMPEPIEAVRFVAECFSYGGDAPDEIDIDVLREIIDLWKDARVVDAGELDDDELDDEWFGDELDEDFEDEDDEDGSAYGGLPRLVTTDGQPIVFCTTEYEVAEDCTAEVVRRLDGMEGLQREQPDGGESWAVFDADGASDLILGRLSLTGRRLELETMSVERSAKLGARLAGVLGELVVLQDITTSRPTPAALMRRAAGRQPPDAPEISPEEQRSFVQSMLEKHYRSWIDEEIPALGNLTPREAAADPEARPQLIELLRDFEKRNRSGPAAMRDFDFSFVWEELGLDRGEAT